MKKPFPGPIVSTQWVAENLDDPDIRILDATVLLSPASGPGEGWKVGSNREAHDALHIPGSHYADLISEFSGPVGRFPRPDIELFSSSIKRLAICKDTRVVVYDRASGVWAARLWWIMRSYGLDRASVLDGGFALWQTEDRPTTSEMLPLQAASTFEVKDRPALFTDRNKVLALVQQGGACLVNALDSNDFHATEAKGYARPGRIPGSLSVPASSLADPVSGRFLSIPIMRERFAEVIGRPGHKVMYCGGGVAACLDALALIMLGEQDVAVYDASLEEWAADPSLPMEIDAPV